MYKTETSLMRRMPFAAYSTIGCLALNSVTAYAVDPVAYLPAHNTGVNTFSTIDLATKSPGQPVTVRGTDGTATVFFGAALNHATGMLYISDDGNSESVFQIDTATNATVRSFFIGDNPRGIAVDPSGRHVYVAQFNGTGVSIIDTNTPVGQNAVTQVDFGNLSGLAFAKPFDVALSLNGARAYVTDSSTNQRLCRFSTVSPPAALSDSDCIGVGADPDSETADPNALAVSPDGTRVYVVNHTENSVSVVDTGTFTVINTFPLGFGSPNAIAINASGKRAYVGTGLGHVLSIDLKLADTSQNPIAHDLTNPAILSVQGVSMSPDGKRLLAVDSDNSMLHFINVVNDADTYDTGVPVSGGPNAWGQITDPDPIFVSGFQHG